jgi:hypothetical protein
LLKTTAFGIGASIAALSQLRCWQLAKLLNENYL